MFWRNIATLYVKYFHAAMRRRNIVIHKIRRTLPGRNLSAASVNQSVMLAALPWPLGSALSLINHSYWVAAAAWSPWLHAPSSWSSSLLSPYTSRRSAQTDSSFSHLGEKEHTVRQTTAIPDTGNDNTLWVKNKPLWGLLLPVTSSDVHWFSKFFHWQTH